MSELQDPWAVPQAVAPVPEGEESAQSSDIASLIDVEYVTDIAPLGPRLGPDAEKFVPEPLLATLFGETKEKRGTFAVLDASRIQGLATLLASSGLEHRCLFKGDAEQELGEVAPWLVLLEEDAPLTRRLFARSPKGKVSPFYLWDAQPGLFFRAEATLEQMWQHLRRFTRVRDEADAWFYFRFWEPEVAGVYFPALQHDMARAQHWLCGPDAVAVDIIACRPRVGDAVVTSPAAGLPMGRANSPFAIGPLERDVFRRVALGKFERDLDTHLQEQLSGWANQGDADDRLLQLRGLIREAKQEGLTVEQATADYCEAALRMGRSPARDPVAQRILQKDQHPVDAGQALLAYARGLKAG